MRGFTRSVFIRRPVEEVFDFATDLDRARLFMPGLVEAEMLTDGGLKPGARFRETRVVKGKQRSAVIEVAEHERPRVHAGQSAMLGMKATYTFRFAAGDGGTRVDLDARVEGNLLWKPLLGTICRAMEMEDGGLLERLRDAMEVPT